MRNILEKFIIKTFCKTRHFNAAIKFLNDFKFEKLGCFGKRTAKICKKNFWMFLPN